VRELLIRFLIGGAVVSSFAALGDMLKPKSFAGLFGAAPSIALATLGLAVAKQGATYAATEARSMTGGAIAFFIYASCVSWVIMKYKLPVMRASSLLLIVWLGSALGIWIIALR
jgi:uncharacterized membrane protein (GlpM family)